jgi:hypothetical protein
MAAKATWKEFEALSDDQRAAVLAHPELYSVRQARAERAALSDERKPTLPKEGGETK